MNIKSLLNILNYGKNGIDIVVVDQNDNFIRKFKFDNNLDFSKFNDNIFVVDIQIITNTNIKLTVLIY